MWFFKKKEKLMPVSLKVSQYKHYEDRFTVEVHKDECIYKISVFDKWSRRYMSDKDKDRNYLQCRDSIFSLDKEINELTKAIKIEVIVEDMKSKLRNEFFEKWNEELKSPKPKKKKSKKKEVKKKWITTKLAQNVEV